MKKSRKGIKVTQGIIVNELKINNYEMKKEYEVHVIFNPANGDLVFEERLDGTFDYLAQEGYFDKKKKIKVLMKIILLLNEKLSYKMLLRLIE